MKPCLKTAAAREQKNARRGLNFSFLNNKKEFESFVKTEEKAEAECLGVCWPFFLEFDNMAVRKSWGLAPRLALAVISH